ncbi:unnamed protein product, partial [Staurois parvus]
MVRQSSRTCHVSQKLSNSGTSSPLFLSPNVHSLPVISYTTMSAVSGHLLYYYYVRSLRSSPVLLCPQSLVISCTTMSAVSDHLLYYYVRSLWSSPVLLCPQ